MTADPATLEQQLQQRRPQRPTFVIAIVSTATIIGGNWLDYRTPGGASLAHSLDWLAAQLDQRYMPLARQLAPNPPDRLGACYPVR